MGGCANPKTYLLLAAFSLTIVSSAMSGTIYVDDDAAGANDGSSWTDAFNYLQDALADANSAAKPVEIRVAHGIYTPDSNSAEPNGTGDRAATFQLINGIILKGGFAGFSEADPNARNIDAYETILSGDLHGNDRDVNDPNDIRDDPFRAENSYHVVTASDTDKTAVLDGFTIASGNANGRYNTHERLGGGMYTDSGGATVLSCKFRSNSAKRSGGGIHNSSSVLRLINCTFQANIAKRGGGMQNQTGDLTFINCTFRDNIATFGAGGMGIEDSNATLTDCAFSGNKAGYMVGGLHSINSNATLTNCILTGNVSFPSQMGMGGGIGGGLGISDGNVIVTECIFNGNSAVAGGGMFGYGSLTLNNCIFSGNSALSWGGGMDNWSRNVPAKINNCIFSGNSAGYMGGGIRNSEYYCSATLTNCTLIGNSAVYGGGGIYNEYKSSATLTNCILWGNTAARGPQVEMRKKESVTEVYYSCIEGGEDEIYDPYDGLIWGPGNIDADPCFIDTGYWDPNGTPDDANDDVWVDGDYHLLSGSPCIDTGDPNYIAGPNETDLDGRPRIIGGRIDMGAYEDSPTISAEIRIVPRTINLQSKGKWINAFLWLPKDYNVTDIDSSSVLLEDEIEPQWVWFDEEEQVAMVRFSREEVQDILTLGEVGLTITGQFTEGTVFEAKDVIIVINNGSRKSAKQEKTK
ncbi:MAG: hypothetical protein GWN67_18155 [Phycisphaerae bacterium]|nr:right-handed parallel beta-helix repeat-containing protein [Phycisphaerae bacterium]NIP55967.1 right-handed parallel beta-helix repeat-containing protein [Phycisphaerae bacterium]NIS54532.1 right-handed parallel beta-helix repeat-containing protein [Phycisphaerae bacterium]NIU12168.1 right-handed parallel beta-helix repeat-containing protein [Phycisphaerae bacterium]NIU58235.1 hypothetical protein [Phycisphaerae bacterium]